MMSRTLALSGLHQHGHPGSLKLRQHGKRSGFAWVFCIRGDLGRVCMKITKALDR